MAYVIKRENRFTGYYRHAGKRLSAGTWDTETEAMIQTALETVKKGRTMIVIAHRLSTIKNASQILVMNGGKIVEQGTHKNLLAKNGVYADLYNSQFLNPLI
jgi:ABC-type multidrug transport system fused ATPase/permease subunit